jgi:FMN phosphatase YigB (HAD superfamily)
VALFDMDEVVLKPEKFYPEILGQDFGFDPRELVFTDGFVAALTNKLDMAEVLANFPGLAGKLSRDQIQEIVEKKWPQAEGVVDYQVIDHILDLKAQGVKICGATNNFKQKCRYINEILLPNIFDGFFSSSSLGCLKPDPAFFKAIIDQLQESEGFEDLRPEEIVYFDDYQEYINSARDLGIDGRLYSQAHQVRSLIHEQAYAF